MIERVWTKKRVGIPKGENFFLRQICYGNKYDSEVASLYENYGNDIWAAAFQEEQTAIFLDRTMGVYKMSLKEVAFSRTQGEEAFLQLCFICEFEDNISGPVFYAYRYYETEGR